MILDVWKHAWCLIEPITMEDAIQFAKDIASLGMPDDVADRTLQVIIEMAKGE